VQALQNDDVYYDLIFMDVQMPKMDGLQATQKIRKLEISRHRHTPIIAMTAYAMREDMERCRDAGMDDYISKPFRHDEIVSALERTIGSMVKTSQRNVQVPPPPHKITNDICTDTGRVFNRAELSNIAYNQENREFQESSSTTAIKPSGGQPPASIVVMETNALQVFDKNELLGRLGGKNNLLPRFLAMFAKNTSAHLVELHQAIDAGNNEQVRVKAHAIRGAAANIAAHKIMRTSSELESLAREDKRDRWHVLAAQLESELQEFNSIALFDCQDSVVDL